MALHICAFGNTVTICYRIDENPPVPNWSGWVAAAISRGYGGVSALITFFDENTATFDPVGFCLPLPRTPTPSPTPTRPPKEPPCPVSITSTGIDVNCGPYYNEISASASVPCMQVDRLPSPRELVAIENQFWLNPGPSENGNYPESWSDSCWPIPNNPEERRPYNYRIGVRWKRLTSMLPDWDFDERPVTSGAAATGRAACSPSTPTRRRRVA